MLDTIVIIPTILAYAFITLLVAILSFIVLYVSHKIYQSVYEHLPGSRADELSYYYTDKMGDRASTIATTNTATEAATARRTVASILERHETLYRKSRTALRIIVTLEPCYLAYVVFRTEPLAARGRPPPQTTESHTYWRKHRLVKYFDRLSTIPHGRSMNLCVAASALSGDSSGPSRERRTGRSSTELEPRPTTSAVARSQLKSVQLRVASPSNSDLDMDGTGRRDSLRSLAMILVRSKQHIRPTKEDIRRVQRPDVADEEARESEVEVPQEPQPRESNK